MHTRERNIDVILDKLLSVVKYFGLKDFVRMLTSIEQCMFPTLIKDYYNPQLMHDNKMVNHGYIGCGFFCAQIGFDYKKFKSLKDTSDRAIKQCLFICMTYKQNMDFDNDILRTYYSSNGIDRTLPDKCVEEIAKYIVDFETMVSLKQELLDFYISWFKGRKYLSYSYEPKKREIVRMPYMNKRHIIYIDYNVVYNNENMTMRYEIDAYPIFKENGEIDDKCVVLMPM